MATGVQFQTKQELIDEVKKFIFPNSQKKIISKNHQQALLDMIESLWDQGAFVKTNVDDSTQEYLEDKLVQGAGIELTVLDNAGVKSIEISAPGDVTLFSVTSTYMSTNGKRVVNGQEVQLYFDTTFTDNSTGGGTPYAADSNSIPDVIPQDFGGYKWFKVEEITVLVDDDLGGTEAWGSLEINDLSSYQAGALTDGDISQIMLWPTAKGVHQYFDFGNENVNGNPDFNLDQQIFPFGAEYFLRSPKDITLSALNVLFKNNAETIGPNATQKFGTIKVAIKGTLL